MPRAKTPTKPRPETTKNSSVQRAKEILAKAEAKEKADKAIKDAQTALAKARAAKAAVSGRKTTKK